MSVGININKTIQKSLMTARLFDGFWDRWIAHGIDPYVATQVKSSINSLEDWVDFFSYYGKFHRKKAIDFEQSGLIEAAERQYKISGLYNNLVQWIIPDRTDRKLYWYKKSLDSFSSADQLSSINCSIKTINVDGKECIGRVRFPKQPKGKIIIINPIDSTKEELYTYEKQFIDLGFATFSFDGPGQGETFFINGLKATTSRWEHFLDKVISLANQSFSHIPIYLFGTSSGANWSIHASQHPLVSKAVAVSPAVSRNILLPDYFTNRLEYILEHKEFMMLPEMNGLSKSKPIYIFHGNKDVMVNDEDIYNLYHQLPFGRKLKEYEEGTHCCNDNLEEIREISAQWFNFRGED